MGKKVPSLIKQKEVSSFAFLCLHKPGIVRRSRLLLFKFFFIFIIKLSLASKLKYKPLYFRFQLHSVTIFLNCQKRPVQKHVRAFKKIGGTEYIWSNISLIHLSVPKFEKKAKVNKRFDWLIVNWILTGDVYTVKVNKKGLIDWLFIKC
jgi:hypothetical protein